MFLGIIIRVCAALGRKPGKKRRIRGGDDAGPWKESHVEPSHLRGNLPPSRRDYAASSGERVFTGAPVSTAVSTPAPIPSAWTHPAPARPRGPPIVTAHPTIRFSYGALPPRPLQWAQHPSAKYSDDAPPRRLTLAFTFSPPGRIRRTPTSPFFSCRRARPMLSGNI